MWLATRAMLSKPGGPTPYGWAAIAVSWLFAAILPVFYWLLSRGGDELAVGKPARLASLAGAIAGVIVIAAGIPVWLEVFRFDWAAVRMLLSDFASFACILLLIAVFRGAALPFSRPLAAIARIAAAAGAIWFVFNLLGLAAIPYAYPRLRAPDRSEAQMIAGAVRTLLEQACFFTAPWLVWFLQPRRAPDHL